MSRLDCTWVRSLDLFTVTVPKEPMTADDVELPAASIKAALVRRDVVLGRVTRPATTSTRRKATHDSE